MTARLPAERGSSCRSRQSELPTSNHNAELGEGKLM